MEPSAWKGSGVAGRQPGPFIISGPPSPQRPAKLLPPIPNFPTLRPAPSASFATPAPPLGFPSVFDIRRPFIGAPRGLWPSAPRHHLSNCPAHSGASSRSSAALRPHFSNKSTNGGTGPRRGPSTGPSTGPTTLGPHSDFSSRSPPRPYTRPSRSLFFPYPVWDPAAPMSDTQESPNLEDLTPEEANRIIHSHRKVRYGTCGPCCHPPSHPRPHLRSRSPTHALGPRVWPADTTYHSPLTIHSPSWATLLTSPHQAPPAGHVASARSSATTRAPVRTASSGSMPSSAPTNPTGPPPGRASRYPRTTRPPARRGRGRPMTETLGGAPATRPARPSAHTVSDPRALFGPRPSPPPPSFLTRASEPDIAETARYVGQNSIPALLREQTSTEPQEANGIRQDMRSLLGLDNSAPFPLMSSRHLDRMTSDISSELPSDREVMK